MTEKFQAPEGAPALTDEWVEASFTDEEKSYACEAEPTMSVVPFTAAVRVVRAAYARGALATQPQVAPADHERQLDEALKERDAASDYIDALLDEVLGADRHEWTSAYGHADAMAEVRERMSTLLQPMADRAWNRFEAAIQAPAEGDATLLAAAKRVIAQGGTAWFSEQQLADENGLGLDDTEAAFIALCSPAAVLAALSVTQPKGTPAGMALVPDYRGYAHLGIGEYVLNHSAAGEPPEVIISIATEEEKVGRVIGEERPNPPGHVLQPDAMAVRLRFANPAGLAALETEIRKMRETHGWEVPCAAVKAELIGGEDGEVIRQKLRTLDVTMGGDGESVLSEVIDAATRCLSQQDAVAWRMNLHEGTNAEPRWYYVEMGSPVPGKLTLQKVYTRPQSETLRRFLYAAAGEGFELGGVDAGELFMELFPDYFEKPQPPVQGSQS